jgi:hypothetical protein
MHAGECQDEASETTLSNPEAAASGELMKRAYVTVLLATQLLGLPGAVHSATWVLRGHGLWSDYRKTSTDSSIGGTSFLELSARSGFQVALERRSGRRLGWELGVGELGIDAVAGFRRLVPVSFDPLVLEEQVTLFDVGPIALRPVTAALLVHVPLGKLDLYLGPLAGVSFFGVGHDLPDRAAEFTYGGRAGVDVLLGRGNWALSVDLRHLQLLHETLDRDLYRDIGLQTIGIGLSYRLRGNPSSRAGDRPPNGG